MAALAVAACIGTSGCFGKVREHRGPEGGAPDGSCEGPEPACGPYAATPPPAAAPSLVPEPLSQSAPLDYCIVFTVAPLKVDVGGEVAVAVFPRSPSETFRWTATDGWFDEPTATSTRYTCDVSGDHVITLEVSDCPGQYTAIVRCR